MSDWVDKVKDFILGHPEQHPEQHPEAAPSAGSAEPTTHPADPSETTEPDA